jgi:hypothetical protein
MAVLLGEGAPGADGSPDALAGLGAHAPRSNLGEQEIDEVGDIGRGHVEERLAAVAEEPGQVGGVAPLRLRAEMSEPAREQLLLMSGRIGCVLRPCIPPRFRAE